MGFSESFATLAMDRNEQERYERLKNSSNPEDRAEAKKMIGDNSNDLIRTYIAAMLKEQQKQKEKELKELEKKLEREKIKKERKAEKEEPDYDAEDEFDEGEENQAYTTTAIQNSELASNYELSVIPENYSNGVLKGHSNNYLLVTFEGCDNLIGNIVNVKINEYQDNKLIGELTK